MPRKTVSIITPHYAPEITAAAYRMETTAKTLSSAFRVHVFTLAEKGKKSNSVKVAENLTIHYVKGRSYNKSIYLLRAIYEIWNSMILVRKSNIIPADLSIVTIPFMFLIPIFIRMNHAKKKIADVRDLVWHYLPDNSTIKRMIKKTLTRSIHHSLHKFDAITLTNEAERRWLIQKGFDDEKIYVIPNGINKEKFRLLSGLVLTPHPQKFTITYVGNIGSSQEFYTLIDAVRDMEDVRVNLIGDGNEFKKIKDFLKSRNQTNVFLPGKMKWSATIPYYQTTDLLFASLKEEFDTAIPSKLYEYLSTGLPVLYHGSGAASNFLKNYKNTFIVSGKNSSELEKIIWRIRKQEINRSDKNIAMTRNFIREKLSVRFVELSARLLNEKSLSNVYVEDLLLNA